MIKKKLIYLDTNVYSGLAEDTSHLHRVEGERLIRFVKKNDVKIISSDIVSFELLRAPNLVKEKYEELVINLKIEVFPDNIDIVNDLVKFYLSRGILTKRNMRDARHIAVATYHGVDALISWNFDDIVNMSKIPRIMGANNEKGFYKNIFIISPLEVR